MVNKPIDKERFQIAVWKVEKLKGDIQEIDKRLAAFSEIKATTYTVWPRVKDTKHSLVEDIATKCEELREEKRVKEFELHLSRIDLSSELDRLFNHLWPGTIEMIRDYYIKGLDTGHMIQKYGINYTDKVKKIVG